MPPPEKLLSRVGISLLILGLILMPLLKPIHEDLLNESVPAGILFLIVVLIAGVGVGLMKYSENLALVWNEDKETLSDSDVEDEEKDSRVSKTDVCVRCDEEKKNVTDLACGKIYLGHFQKTDSQHKGDHVVYTHSYDVVGSHSGFVCNACVQDERKRVALRALKWTGIILALAILFIIIKAVPFIMLLILFGAGAVVVILQDLFESDADIRDHIVKEWFGDDSYVLWTRKEYEKLEIKKKQA